MCALRAFVLGLLSLAPSLVWAADQTALDICQSQLSLTEFQAKIIYDSRDDWERKYIHAEWKRRQAEQKMQALQAEVDRLKAEHAKGTE